MLLILAALGARLWFDHKAKSIVGPQLISANDNWLLVEHNRELPLVDAGGELQSRTRLSDLGIRSSLMDLQLLDRNTVLLGVRSPTVIKMCSLTVHHCKTLDVHQLRDFGRHFKFYFAEQKKLYLSDTDRHSIYVADVTNGAGEQIAKAPTVRYPNDLFINQPGQLAVVDTNRHRIAVFDLSTLPAGEPSMTIGARTNLSDRTWPIDATVLPGGDWAVLIADGMLNNAHAVLFDSNGRPLKRLEQPRSSNLQKLAVFSGQLVLTSRDDFRLYTLGADENALVTYGADSLDSYLTGSQQRQRNWQQRSQLALYILIALVIIAFVAGARVLSAQINKKQEHRHQPSSVALLKPVGAYPGVVWVSADPRTTKKLRLIIKLLPLLALLVVVLVVVLGFLISEENLTAALWTSPLRELLIFTLLLLFAVSVLAFYVDRVFQRRIGSDGYRLYISLADNRAIAIPPEEAVYNDHMIAYRRYAVMVQNYVGMALYPSDRIRDFIMPLVQRGHRLGEINMMLYQLRHGEPIQTGSILFAIIVVLLVVIWFEPGIQG